MTEKRFLLLGGRIKTDNNERTTKMNMTVHDVNGNEFHITKDEAERIAAELAKMGGHETNKTFMERAQNNIAAVAGFKPTSEDELKMVLYKNLRGPSMPEIEILVEAMEYVAAMHKQKVG